VASLSGHSLSGYGLNYAKIAATSDGDNVVIEGAAGQHIVVLGYALNVNAAGVVKFQDTASSPVVKAEFEFADGGGATYTGGPYCPAFELAVGVGLEVNVATGVDGTGHLTYVLIDR
jgi:hypothetical protein